eukprot:192736_1
MSMILILLDIFLISILNVQSSEVTISTTLGDIKGENVDDLGNIYTFKGIPYVQNQPIGSFRWKQSNLKTSPYIGTYDATNFGPTCIQRSPSPGESEACLQINIHTNSISPNANLPVMVHIHGGGFDGGSGPDPFLGGDNPPQPYASEDIVFVTFNYRLGAFGFLPLQEIKDESDGLYNGGLNGIADQIVALNWIQQYISDFGGNPNQVTVWGISAGSYSICRLLVSPQATNLFKNAILGSGTCYSAPGSRELSESDGFKYALQELETQGITDTSLTMLRTLPFDNVRRAYIRKSTIDGDTFNNVQSIDSKVRLTLDGYVLNLREGHFELFTKDKKNDPLTINAENVILGFTNQESLLNQPFFATNFIFPRTESEYDRYIAAYIDDVEDIEAIDNKYYPLSDYPVYQPVPPPPFPGFPPAWPEISGVTSKWSTIQGDCETCGTLRSATILHEQLNNIQDSGTKIYAYNLRGESPYYTYHGSDIGFGFFNPNNPPFFFPFFTFLTGITYDIGIATLFQSSLINFVVNDDPGNNWSEFGKDSNVMVFENDNSGIVTNYVKTFRHGACEWWIDDIGLDTMGIICEQSHGLVEETGAMNNSLGIDNGNITTLYTAGIIVVILGIVIVALVFYVFHIKKKMRNHMDTVDNIKQMQMQPQKEVGNHMNADSTNVDCV